MSHQYRFWGIILLAVGLRVWLAVSDSYLHEWDERYHALVAKHLIQHPLMPTLYETPLLDYDVHEWASNHIWLSKPPLPLWIMALSLKIWGFTEWAVRFPSILFSLGSIFLTYKIADRLWGQNIGLWAAFFHAIHGLSLEVASGRFSSDHVETAFIFWMELGFWGIVLYQLSTSQKAIQRYAMLIGAATGLAFMCKWTAAFMLPIVWATVSVLSHRKTLFNLMADGLIALSIFALIAAPWPLYILKYYPVEANILLVSLISPVKETIQGHGGAWYYYLVKSGVLFGQVIYLPLCWLLWTTAKSWAKSKETAFGHILLSVWIFVPLILLSCAATKRHTYLLPMAPAFFMLTALFMRFLLQKRQSPGYSVILGYLIWAALLVLPIRYAVERTKLFSTHETNPLWAQQLKNLGRKESEHALQTVIINEPHPIEAMFYTGITAYPGQPSIEKLAELKQKGYRILDYQQGNYIEQ